MKNIFIVLLIFLLGACSSYRPILDKNDAPPEQSQKDIDECLQEADEYLQDYKKRKAAKEAGRKAVIGAVVGATTSVLFGRNLKGIIASTAIGAGIGAGVGALSVAGEDKVTPSKIKQNYVSNCLARRGYGVIGWE